MSTPVIRTARKTYSCVNRRAKIAGNAPDCFGWINPGDRYEQGDVDPYYAGGFGHERICAGCSKSVREERQPHVLGQNCHVCGTNHGTAHYFRVCAASGIETGTAKTEGLGPKDESPAPQEDAQP